MSFFKRTKKSPEKPIVKATPLPDEPIITKIPHLPAQVDLKIIKINGKLYDDNHIAYLKALLRTKKDGGYQRKYLTAKILERKYRHFGRDKKMEFDHAVLRVTVKEKGKSKVRYVAICDAKVVEGKFGNFKVGQDLETGEFVGIKRNLIVRLEGKNNFHTIEILRTEHKVIGELQKNKTTLATAPPIPKIYKIFNIEDEAKPDKIQILMDYIPGMTGGKFLQSSKLHSRIHPVRLLDLAIIGAMNLVNLHKAGFLHRDIKFDNLIMGITQKLFEWIDHGFAVRMDPGKREYRTYDLVGSLQMLAPEVIAAKCKSRFNELVYTEKCDIYSLGMTLRIMLGFPFYQVKVDPELDFSDFKGCLNIEEKPLQYYRTTLSDEKEIDELLNRMIDMDPKERPNDVEMLESLQRCREQLAKTAPPLKIAFVNIAEFHKYFGDEDSESERKEYVDSLKDFNEIVFVGDIKEWKEKDKIYSGLQVYKQYFENNGLIVNENCIENPEPAVLQNYCLQIQRQERLPVQGTYFSPTIGLYEIEVKESQIESSVGLRRKASYQA